MGCCRPSAGIQHEPSEIWEDCAEGRQQPMGPPHEACAKAGAVAWVAQVTGRPEVPGP